jgi:opacity protein-like surface antigen
MNKLGYYLINMIYKKIYPFKLVLIFLFLVPVILHAKGIDLFDRYYIGGGTGLASSQFSSDADHTDNNGYENFENKRDSGMMGFIQLGKDWQLENDIVFGIVLDYSMFDDSHSEYGGGSPPDIAKVSSNDSYALKVKLGYLLNDRTLAYGILGVGSLRGEFKFTNGSNGSNGSKDFSGANMILGAGINYFTPYSDNWSLTFEALYYPSGPKTSVGDDELSTDTDDGDFGLINGMYMLKAGINYSFGDAKESSKKSYTAKVFNSKLFDRIYVGGGAGLAFTEYDACYNCSSNTNYVVIDRSSDTDGLLFMQIGRDWQFDNNFVLGLNLDYQILNNKVSGSGEDPTDVASVESRDMISLSGKFGYLLSERILTYGTLGLASYGVEYNVSDSDESASDKFRKINLLVGAGVEWFTPYSDKVSFKLEGLYFPTRIRENYDEDEYTSSMDEVDYAQVNDSTLIRFGLNYSF